MSEETKQTFEQLIPEEFRAKPYLADLKAMDVGPEAYGALFKKFDNAQQLIGRKTGIPDPDAAPEEWDKFHERLRPQSADEYELTGQPDDEAKTAIRAMFHESGLSKRQAQALQERFNQYVSSKLAAQTEEQKKLDAEFDKLTQDAFGPQNAEVLARSKVLLEKLTPDNIKPHLARMSNEALVVLAGVMESVRAKYMGEDGLGSGDVSGNSAPDIGALREEGRTLMASEAYKNAWHKEHDKTVARVKALYEQVGKLTSKK